MFEKTVWKVLLYCKIGVEADCKHEVKMSDDAAREDACREYQSSLEDLTFNSKPHINMLTILAEENLHFAKDIVAIIEAQIAKVFMKIEFLISAVLLPL